MKKYLSLLEKVLLTGDRQQNRTGIDTFGLFGEQLKFDLSLGFPVVTTKKIHLKSIIHELLWFISGDTNTKYLTDNGVTIWNEWADDKGGLGPIYGKQWRDFNGVDQLSDLIERIKTNPECRRLIISAWNPVDLPDMALPPCHCFMQFRVNTERKELSLHLYQRSADLFLGVPFNITSYALLLCLVSKVTGYQPRHFIHSFGDVHIYENHVDQVMTQIRREPKDLPSLRIPFKESIDDYEFGDISIAPYHCHPAIKGDVAV